MKILITGGQGQIATALQHLPLATKLKIFACSQSECDITEAPSIDQAFSRYLPDIVINTAAYTAVDKAEQEKELAFAINHQGAKNIAIACQKSRIPLLHLSTDYIFDGRKTSAYQEEDIAHPVNVYGASKWQGEEAVRSECEQYFILRVSGVFSQYGKNFLKTILRRAQELTLRGRVSGRSNSSESLRIVADQITCPTFAGDIAQVLLGLAHKKNHWGTYHYCSQPAVSWYEFAVAILQTAGGDASRCVPITTPEYPAAATRPAYSVLDCSKIQRVFAIMQPDWRKSLKGSL